jgi:arsenite methyltransferase
MSQDKLLTPYGQATMAPDYILRIPSHVRNVLGAGLLVGLAGIGLIFILPENQRSIAYVLLTVGVLAALATLILMVITDRQRRLQARQTMLDAIAWRGDEVVLDVGCGNGFLLLEAAKHLTGGKAIGIDIWKDAAGQQSADVLRRNAQIEGVTPRIDLKNCDARAMPFEAETFDVILSSLALHHMGSAADREQALHEMIRVLKPGGVILFYDMFPMIAQAAAVMRRNRLSQVRRLSGLAMVVLSANKLILSE